MTYRRSHRWILGVLLVLLAGGIFFAPSYGWRIRQWLTPGSGVGEASSAAPGDALAPNLEAQNEALEAQVAIYQTVEEQLPQASPRMLRAMVYSRYPLNFKNELLLDAGADHGVTTGTAVLFQGMLIGRIAQVFAHESLAETIFDSGFTMPVRVGTSSYDGLFEGGSYPKIGSIARTAGVAAGSIVYAAGPGMPYGLPVGQVSATSTSADSLFTEATLVFPYDINKVQTVVIAQGS
ncbi:MAG TPA: rod shape-determining protein MreC [Candidatus Paceibacterota bacterium]|nr:rod shape-determining protein MreC [Candidatus Paceibacterota bacterium]